MMTYRLPDHINQYHPKHSKRFPEWLRTRDAVIQPPQNDSELLRFDTHLFVGLIIVSNTTGKLRWSHEAESAFDCYHNGKAWDQHYRFGKRMNGNARKLMRAAVIARDGNNCVVCSRNVTPIEGSIEHFISVTHGGPSTIENLILVHTACNGLLGVLSIKEKLELIVQTRIKRLYFADNTVI